MRSQPIFLQSTHSFPLDTVQFTLYNTFIHMKRAHQIKRDQKWYSLISTSQTSISQLAKMTGYHRNTISNAVNKIRKANEQK